MLGSPATSDRAVGHRAPARAASRRRMRPASSCTRRDPLVVAAGRHVCDEQRRCFQWSNTTARSTTSRPIGGTGADDGSGTGWPSSSVRGLERDVAHQPPGQGRKVGQPRGAQRPRDRDQRLARCRRRRRRSEARGPRRSIRSPSRSPTTTAAGSPATNEYRPHRSERSTDSSSSPGRRRRAPGTARPGVETSASSSAQTGTRGQSAASESNVSRSGRMRSCTW